MAGIYIHIPFCRQKCHYCDFYSCTSLAKKAGYLDALRSEIAYRRDFLAGETVSTIYFGGGTPSLLEPSEIGSLVTACRKYHEIDPVSEITLELNPDDIRNGYPEALREAGVNRLSIGIQSFIDRDLEFMNRRHSAKQARVAVDQVRKAGFENITIDLIYGIPGMSDTEWDENLTQAISLNPEHISAYHLTLEPDTPWGKAAADGLLRAVPEETGRRQFDRLHARLEAAGYNHYEISNFARPGFESRHNGNYWKGVPYLGLGPSAHSFRDNIRGWNAADLDQYLAGVTEAARDSQFLGTDGPDTSHNPAATRPTCGSESQTSSHYTEELLDENARYNEYLLTRLRTKEGLGESELSRLFGACKLRYFRAGVTRFVRTGVVRKEGDRYYLPPAHFFVSDGVISDLFYA